MSTLRDAIVPFQSAYGEDTSNSEMTPAFVYAITQRDSNNDRTINKNITSLGFSANNLDSKKKAERPHFHLAREHPAKDLSLLNSLHSQTFFSSHSNSCK